MIAQFQRHHVPGRRQASGCESLPLSQDAPHVVQDEVSEPHGEPSLQLELGPS